MYLACSACDAGEEACIIHAKASSLLGEPDTKQIYSCSIKFPSQIYSKFSPSLRLAAPTRPLYAIDITTSPLFTSSSGFDPADQ